MGGKEIPSYEFEGKKKIIGKEMGSSGRNTGRKTLYKSHPIIINIIDVYYRCEEK